MNEALRGHYYGNDEEVKNVVKNWPDEFCEAGIHAVIRRWNAALDRGGDYVQN